MILGILQARLSSTRLPGKVLKLISGKPMLELQVERVRRSQLIGNLAVSTSEEPSDDAIADLCGKIKTDLFRGSLDDVLDRFYKTACVYNPENVVRLTGDCPLADPSVIDAVIELHIRENNAYTSNVHPATYPDGLDVEVFTFEALKSAWEKGVAQSEREHVTPYIVNHPERFKIGNFLGDKDLSHLRWSVDEPEDFDLVTEIYKELYQPNPQFTTDDILDLLAKRPELQNMNLMHKRNEGYAESMSKERKLVND